MGLAYRLFSSCDPQGSWTKIAPKWMIYTLSVLLAGVWGHYLFAIISLIRIKIDAARKAKEEYRM